MKLSESAVKEFQEIFKDEFGDDIPFADAEIEAQSLLNLFSVLLKKP